MKIQEIRAKSDAELHAETERLRRELYNLRAQAVSNPAEDTTRFRKSRRDVARILMVLTEHARAAGKPVALPAAPKPAKPVKAASKPAKAVKADAKPAAAKPEKTEKTGKKPAPKAEKAQKSDKKGQKG